MVHHHVATKPGVPSALHKAPAKDPKSAIESADAMLLDAAAKGDAARARAALLHGAAEVDARNSKGETALILAAAGGHMDVVQLLKNAKADPFAIGQDNLTARGRAEKAGHDRVASALKAYEEFCTKECDDSDFFSSD